MPLFAWPVVVAAAKQTAAFVGVSLAAEGVMSAFGGDADAAAEPASPSSVAYYREAWQGWRAWVDANLQGVSLTAAHLLLDRADQAAQAPDLTAAQLWVLVEGVPRELQAFADQGQSLGPGVGRPNPRLGSMDSSNGSALGVGLAVALGVGGLIYVTRRTR